MFPRIYALEENKECSVAVKLQGDVEFSLRRQVRGGVEAQQLVQLQDLIGSSVLVNAEDRYEDTSHLLFRCTMAADVTRLVCRWWDLVWKVQIISVL
ncbi:hypothetical protein Tco_0101664 [Tanacetum coccineum]